MKPIPVRRAVQRTAAVLLATGGTVAHAQSLEPRNYSNAPVGMNFVNVGVLHTTGGLSFDPSIPVKNPELSVWTSFAAFSHVFDAAGQSARVDVLLPYARLSGTAEYLGQPVERRQDGLADASLRLSVNLHGAPAMKAAEFRHYEQALVAGASLQITAPTGAYDNRRIVNIGANRWTIKPEIGVSRAFGPLVVEMAASASLFTDNTDFYGGSVRKQDPIYALQAHSIYVFSPGLWAALSYTYFEGGKTQIDGKPGNDLQQNTRIGGTVSVPLSRYQSVKFTASNGVSARTGNNFTLFALSWQTRWGEGF